MTIEFTDTPDAPGPSAEATPSVPSRSRCTLTTWLVAGAVFALALVILWRHAAPTVTYHDGGEFSLAAASAGVPHPPGAPTWTLLAWAFVKLGGFEDAARGTNLFCGFMGALTLGLLSALVQLWLRRMFPGGWWLTPILGGVIAPLVLLHSPGFLEQSLTTEQYTLMTALIGGMLLAATGIVRIEPGRRPPRAIDARTRWLLRGLGLMFGLAIGNHLTQITLGLFVVLVILAARWPERRPADWLRMGVGVGAGFAAGLMVFLYVPLRSLANPIMDWGNVQDFDRFLWAIMRMQWAKRPLSEAPPGFVEEWIASYRPLENLTLIGFALALVGMVALVKHHKHWLLWLAAVSMPYAVVLLLGHMKQMGMNVTYVRVYGVVDWHLPLYQSAAAAAGIGAGWIVERLRAWEGVSLPGRNAGWAAGTAAAIMLVWLGLADARSIDRASLRNDPGADDFIHALLAPLPEDAMVVTVWDSTSHMLAWHAYGGGPDPHNLRDPDRWIAYGFTCPVAAIQHAERRKDGWNRRHRLLYLGITAANPNDQPLRVEPPGVAEALSRPFIAEYRAEVPEAAPYMLPVGLLFEIRDEPVSNGEVIAAERAWREAHPDLFKRPDPDAYRLECEAWSTCHAQRGAFFMERGLWPLAREAFEHSLAWMADNGLIWYFYGYTLEQVGETGRAVDAYRLAIEQAPRQVGPRANLAVLYAEVGQLRRAEALLLDELELDPENREARHNLRLVRRQLAAPIETDRPSPDKETAVAGR